MSVLHVLISESETREARDSRRATTGRSSGETFKDLLLSLEPDAACELVQTVEAGPERHPSRGLGDYDAIVLAGSPLHVYAATPEVRRQVAFMGAVFASGTPSFGSCAGLQIAVAAAGGTVRRNPGLPEIAFARRILRTEVGRHHPMLNGRPDVFDALAVHSDEVETLPPDAELLAGNRHATVQAAAIRHAGGTFWGVQYHPELPLAEIADALRRQSADLVAQGFADTDQAIDSYANMIAALDAAPERRDLAWRLGLDQQVTDAALRQTEIRNFLYHLVRPTQASRGRG